MRIFQDRRDAGKELAQLVARKHYSKPVVLALPRGGLAVAAEVARALKAPLDLVLVRKIGLPSQPELAVGAIVDGHDPVVVINKELQFFVDNHPEEFDRLKRRELEELERRRIVYLKDRPRAPLEGKTVIVVDDGLATGATARAAIRALRRARPAKLVLAIPVAPADTLVRLRKEVDDIICVEAPREFYAIGLFYDEFAQLNDDDVRRYLAEFPMSDDSKADNA